MAAPASMSSAEAVGLACAAGFTGDASGPGRGGEAGLPQLESKTASKMQPGAIRILCEIMPGCYGHKGCEEDSVSEHALKSSELSTTFAAANQTASSKIQTVHTMVPVPPL